MYGKFDNGLSALELVKMPAKAEAPKPDFEKGDWPMVSAKNAAAQVPATARPGESLIPTTPDAAAPQELKPGDLVMGFNHGQQLWHPLVFKAHMPDGFVAIEETKLHPDVIGIPGWMHQGVMTWRLPTPAERSLHASSDGEWRTGAPPSIGLYEAEFLTSDLNDQFSYFGGNAWSWLSADEDTAKKYFGLGENYQHPIDRIKWRPIATPAQQDGGWIEVTDGMEQSCPDDAKVEFKFLDNFVASVIDRAEIYNWRKLYFIGVRFYRVLP